MNTNKMHINNILSATAHRTWELPKARWKYYQEWNNVLFLHWKFTPEELLPLIPKGVELDTFNGDAYLSLVVFTMEKIRPRGFPSLSFISTFHEINIRTYVKDDMPGVYFINMEGEKELSVRIARLLSGMPYEKAAIKLEVKEKQKTFSSVNKKKGFQLEASFIEKEQRTKNELDNWLTERYCVYLDKGDKLYRYNVHHLPWDISEVEIINLKTDYAFGKLSLNRKPELAQYSKGVKVVAWNRETLL